MSSHGIWRRNDGSIGWSLVPIAKSDNSTGDRSGAQASTDEIAGLDVQAGADKGPAIGLECQAVAASKHGQGAKSLEAGGEPGRAMPLVEQVLAERLAGALE